MTFRAFSSIMIGMAMIGFSVGIVVGVYIHTLTARHYWAYLAVPVMALGGGIAIYGTLHARQNGAPYHESRDGSVGQKDKAGETEQPREEPHA